MNNKNDENDKIKIKIKNDEIKRTIFQFDHFVQID
jgi:hypothetical protein